MGLGFEGFDVKLHRTFHQVLGVFPYARSRRNTESRQHHHLLTVSGPSKVVPGFSFNACLPRIVKYLFNNRLVLVA